MAATVRFRSLADCFSGLYDLYCHKGTGQELALKNGGHQDAKFAVIFFCLLLKYVNIEVSFKLSLHRVAICECTRSLLEASCQEAGCSFMLFQSADERGENI